MHIDKPPPAEASPIERGSRDSEADTVADVLVSAMWHAGIERIYFASGSDIIFLQEAVAKARANGRPTPDLITVMHEIVALSAATGDATVRRRPAATAVHVEVGTLNYGTSLNTVAAEGAPVLMLSGSPARADPGSMPGARDNFIQWVQEQQDQRQIARNYSKWQFRLEFQDSPGLVISRALQVAMSAPRGPVFLTVPREVGMASTDKTSFPSVDRLGVARPSGPDMDAIEELAGRLLAAENPLIIAGRSGEDPAALPALVEVAELLGAPVTDNGVRYRTSFPTSHPLFETNSAVCEADALLVVERKVPWVPAGMREVEKLRGDPRDLAPADPRRAPAGDCFVAWLAQEPTAAEIPMYGFPGHLRIAADPVLGLRALADAISDQRSSSQCERASARLRSARQRKEAQLDEARRPIRTAGDQAGGFDPRWIAQLLAKHLSDDAILLNEALSPAAALHRYCRRDQPQCYFTPEGTGGGWGPGAAVGAKLAMPEREVVLVTGDGFWAYGVPSAALWTAAHYKAPFIALVLVNSRYSTGTDAVDMAYPDGYAARAGYPGGRFDPAPDFAAEAAAGGALGIKIDVEAELEPALRRGLAATSEGQAAVITVPVP